METISKRSALIANVLFITEIGNLPKYLKFRSYPIRTHQDHLEGLLNATHIWKYYIIPCYGINCLPEKYACFIYLQLMPACIAEVAEPG